jgi:hypothetical protein
MNCHEISGARIEQMQLPSPISRINGNAPKIGKVEFNED